MEHIASLTEHEPTLFDLFDIRDLWEKLERYWRTASGEIEKRLVNFKSIRLIDFDLIYPAFWAAEAQTKESLLERRMGFPVTASFVFKDTRSLFTIPPGSYFELTYQIRRLQETVRISTTNLDGLLSKFESLKERNWKERSRESLSGTFKLLRATRTAAEEEIDRLVEAKIKVEALSQIVNHGCYLPWDEVMRETESFVEPDEVFGFWSMLQISRKHPDKDLSNYLDALNVASYYSLARAAHSDRERANYFPLFASGTQPVLDLPPADFAARNQSSNDKITRPVSMQYLTFATALEIYADNILETMSAIADIQSREIQDLIGHWKRLWRDVKSHYKFEDEMRRDDFQEIRLKSLVQFSSFNPFCEAYVKWKNSFDRVVGNTFLNVTQADRQMGDNIALAKRRLLGDGGDDEFPSNETERAGTPTGDLTESFDWSWRASSVNSGLLLRHYYPRQLNVTEITLASLRKSGIIREEGYIFPEPATTYRTKVSLWEVAQPLFYWERVVGKSSQLCCWEYSLLSLEQMLNSVGEFFVNAQKATKFKNQIRLHIFAEDSDEELTIGNSAPEGEWMRQVLAVTKTPHYLRFETDVCILYLDVVPIEPTTGLEIAVLYESRKLHNAVSNLHRETSGIRFPEKIIKALLLEFEKTFKAKEERITAFAQSQKIIKTDETPPKEVFKVNAQAL